MRSSLFLPWHSEASDRCTYPTPILFWKGNEMEYCIKKPMHCNENGINHIIFLCSSYDHIILKWEGAWWTSSSVLPRSSFRLPVWAVQLLSTTWLHSCWIKNTQKSANLLHIDIRRIQSLLCCNVGYWRWEGILLGHALNSVLFRRSNQLAGWDASGRRLSRRRRGWSLRSTTPSWPSTSTPTRGSSRKWRSSPPSLFATRFHFSHVGVLLPLFSWWQTFLHQPQWFHWLQKERPTELDLEPIIFYLSVATI